MYGHGIRHLGDAVLRQELSDQQGMFGTTGSAKQAYPAPERRHFRPHDAEGDYCALQRYVVDIRRRRPVHDFGEVAAQRRGPMRCE